MPETLLDVLVDNNRPVYKDRHARNSSWPGELISTQRPYTFAQTCLLSLSFFLAVRAADHTFALSAQDILDAVQKLFPQQQGMPTGKGKVQVVSTVADAEVYIDGKFVGDTPSTVPLSAGDHTIEVKASHFSDWKRTISVTDGSDLNVKANLQSQ